MGGRWSPLELWEGNGPPANHGRGMEPPTPEPREGDGGEWSPLELWRTLQLPPGTV